MIKKYVCIVCPNSCSLTVDGEGNVTGAGCPRGEKFAREEAVCPKRTVCSTVATVFADRPVLPVRTSAEIPKEKIPEAMEIIRGICVDRRLERGEVLVHGLAGTDADLISTSSMCYRYVSEPER